jgi:RNA polymerase sigma-70 factor (ECF subfamily)
VDDAGSPAPGPLYAANLDETVSALGRALDGLPFRDRSLVLLRDGQGLSYDEMSRVLDAPVGTIKAAVHRARLRLRDHLDTLETKEPCS